MLKVKYLKKTAHGNTSKKYQTSTRKKQSYFWNKDSLEWSRNPEKGLEMNPEKKNPKAEYKASLILLTLPKDAPGFRDLKTI